MSSWKKHQVPDLPEGQCGVWKVERFKFTEKDAEFALLRSCNPSTFGRGSSMKPGIYTKLTRGGCIVMSDTPDEIRDHYPMITRAEGNILINGLGLGVVLNACLSKVLSDDGTSAGREMAVEHATVVERDKDVIDLVGPHYEMRFGDRLTIIHADALEWKAPRGVRYNAVWHDIWDDICADNLDDMKTLHRKYGRRSDWQGSWCRGLCERQRDTVRW